MDDLDTVEVYIPMEAEVTSIPLLSLPKSVLTRKGFPLFDSKVPLTNGPEAVWISPVVLRKKGPSAVNRSAKEKIISLLSRKLETAQGPFQMSFVSSSHTAYRVLKDTLPGSKVSSTTSDTPLLPLGTRSQTHQSALVIYHGQIYLTIKEPACGWTRGKGCKPNPPTPVSPSTSASSSKPSKTDLLNDRRRKRRHTTYEVQCSENQGHDTPPSKSKVAHPSAPLPAGVHKVDDMWHDARSQAADGQAAGEGLWFKHQMDKVKAASADGGLCASPEADCGPYASPEADGRPYASPETAGGPYASPEAAGGPYASPEAAGGPYASPEAAGGPYASPEADGGPCASPEADGGSCASPEADGSPCATQEADGSPCASPEADSGPCASPETDGGPYASPETDGGPCASPETDGGPSASPETDGGPSASPETDGGPSASPETDGGPCASPETDGSPCASPETDGGPSASPETDGGPSASPETDGGPSASPETDGGPSASPEADYEEAQNADGVAGSDGWARGDSFLSTVAGQAVDFNELAQQEKIARMKAKLRESEAALNRLQFSS